MQLRYSLPLIWACVMSIPTTESFHSSFSGIQLKRYQEHHAACSSGSAPLMGIPSKSVTSVRPSLRRNSPLTIVKDGTVVVYFGKKKELNAIELYKFNFYQKRFNYLCEKGKAKEALGVMLASESEIQMSPQQALGLLQSLSAQVLGLDKEEDVEPIVSSIAKLLKDHSLWHLTPTRQGKDAVEKDIAVAEKKLRKMWQNAETRHILLEIQPFFAYTLKVKVPATSSDMADFDQRCDMFFEKLLFADVDRSRIDETTSLNSAALLLGLDNMWEMKYKLDKDTLTKAIMSATKKTELGKEDFQALCKTIIQL